MSVEVIYRYSHSAAPSMSPPQSDEKVRQAVMIANIDASMFYGITYIIFIVIGSTARQVKIDWLKSIKNKFIVQSLKPQVSVHRTTFAYMRHVWKPCKIKEKAISFHAENFIKKLRNIMVPIKLPVDYPILRKSY